MNTKEWKRLVVLNLNKDTYNELLDEIIYFIVGESNKDKSFMWKNLLTKIVAIFQSFKQLELLKEEQEDDLEKRNQNHTYLA